MQNYYIRLFFIVLFGVVSPLYAQEDNLLEKAERFYREKKYMNALSFYEEAIGMNRNNPKALFGAGICYLQLHVPENAYEYFKLINRKKTDELSDFYFWYARVCYMNEKFDSAMININAYLAKPGAYQKEAEELVAVINDALTVSRIQNDYMVENAGEHINSQYAEFGVMVGRDPKKIVFTRSTREVNLKQEGKKSDGAEEIFTTELKNDDKWLAPNRVASKLNSSGEDAAVQLLEDDKRMLIYQDGDLKTIEFINGEWRAPVALPKGVNTSKVERHAFIYDFGTKIIFASNAGTKGDLDLFESSIKRDGSWSTPVPLTALNTEADENTPFISNNGKTMYFSSKGHYSMGGYDVFRSEYDPATKQWSKPVNMGSPINSVSDDWFFSLYDNIGYLTSNRIGGMGEEDLYRVFLFSKVKVTGRVYHRTSGHVVRNCTLKFFQDNQTFEASSDDNGVYELELPFHKPLHVKVYNNNKALYEETLKLSINPKKPRVVNRNYYIDYTDKPGKEATDSEAGSKPIYATGSIRDGKSGKPLDAVVQLLDPATDQVIKTTTTDVNGNYSIYAGTLKGKYVIEASRKGYIYKTMEFNTGELASKGSLDMKLFPIETDAKFILYGVNFETNSDVLTASSFAELNKLYIFMNENSEVKVEISGHTDNVGKPEVNLKLSHDRAGSVVQFLIDKGISSKRMIIKGYGETQPIATNSQEEEGRELNRRIEVKFIK